LKSIKKIPKTFISFLIISLLIWLLITLSKEYTTSIFFPISYSNLPQDKLLEKDPVTEIEFLVKGSGFKILSTKFNRNSILLNTDNLRKKTATKYFFLLKNQQVNIQKQLLSGLQIQQIIKDTIYLEIGSLTSKKVPVRLDLNIKYHVGYDASTSIEITPDSILISGPKKQVSKIKELRSSFLSLDDVKSNFEKTLLIMKPENSKNINFSNESVQIKVNVEKFTEGSFKIPFKVINLPSDIQLATLTKMVEIVFIVGLSDFNKITLNSFRVECDFEVSEKNNLGYLIPKIVMKPDVVKSIKVLPNKIDFLIQK
jgi:YbbR domain-containing protein